MKSLNVAIHLFFNFYFDLLTFFMAFWRVEITLLVLYYFFYFICSAKGIDFFYFYFITYYFYSGFILIFGGSFRNCYFYNLFLRTCLPS